MLKSTLRSFKSLSFLSSAMQFALTLAIMAVGSYFIVVKIQEISLENISRESHSSAQFVSQTIARPLWNLNRLAVRDDLKALSESDIFCGARVLDDEGKVFASLDFPQSINTEQLLITESILFDDPTDDASNLISIGTLEMCATMAPFKAQLADVLQRLITAFGILSVAILLATHLSLQIVFSPLRRFKEAMSEYLVSMRPISDKKLLQENEVGDLVQSFNILAISLSESYRALKRAKDEAETAYKVKTDFFANMSHELRTPLNSVIGMTQLLQNMKMDDEQREMFDSVRRSADALLKIVNDILDISKIEAKQIQLEYVAFDAYKEVRHTVQSLKPLASQKNITLSFEAAQSKSLVFGDPMRFSRIVTNLISNAVRYTEKGRVTVYARALKVRENRINMTIEVEDTGIGIPADKIDKIFEKFSQADTSTTRKYGGTGLGLTITKELVELMGGHIYVTSEVGKGSVFSITIPFEMAQQEDLKQKHKTDEFSDSAPQNLTGIPISTARILIAEDHVMNQLFMKKLFKNLGMIKFTLVENGREAVNELKINAYDLVLMDCHMPEMNGYDATVAIRNLDDPIRRAIPIVAMTANAMPEDEQRCLSVGMSGYISKPVDIGVFKRVLGQWLNFSVQEALVSVQSQPPVTAPADEPEDAGLPVNLDNLKANSMGDLDFEKEMISMFVSQGRRQLDELKTHCVHGPSHDWVEVAHALKGTAGSVGAEKMREKCAAAQLMEDVSADDRTKKLARIEADYSRVVAYLTKEGLYKPE
ncbi:MAG: sensor histidine kinase [Proteobacteria bacterium]|nr:sensor histidine kinase [Pseudomonadota bacterium]